MADQRKNGPAPTCVLLAPNPYLSFLIHQELPRARVIVVDPSDSNHEDLEQVDLVIADLTMPGARDLVQKINRAKIIGILDGAEFSESDLGRHLDGVLLTPFLPGAFIDEVRGVLGGQPRKTALARRLLMSDRVLRWLRLAAVVYAAALEILDNSLLEDPLSSSRTVIVAAALSYCTLRILLRRTDRGVLLIDVVFSVALISLTGVLFSPYLVFGLICIYGASVGQGVASALLLTSVISAGLVILDANWERQMVSLLEPAVLSGLLLLTGLFGSISIRAWEGAREEAEIQLLERVNQMLSTLYRLARATPGRMDVGSIATSAVESVREVVKSPAVLIFLETSNVFGLAAASGIDVPEQVILGRDGTGIGDVMVGGIRTVDRLDLPDSLGELLGAHEKWLVCPLKTDERSRGVILAASSGGRRLHADMQALRKLIERYSVALDEARLTEKIGELGFDDERRRLARELHDGVAQSLTHVRMELDYLASDVKVNKKEAQEEAARLSQVVRRVQQEVRKDILDLRSGLSVRDLAASIRDHIRDAETVRGPKIVFSASVNFQIPPWIEDEIFRLFQEALTNALKHARASLIEVSLRSSWPELQLVVEDNGVGMSRVEHTGGVGLSSMRERAERIGARLSVTGGRITGTRIELVLDMREVGPEVPRP